MTAETRVVATPPVTRLRTVPFVQLRSLQPDDAEALREVRLEALIDSGECFRVSYEEERRKDTAAFADLLRSARFDRAGGVLGAFRDDDLVGMIGYRRAAEVQSRHIGYVWGLYVTPSVRWQGIGRALLREGIEQLRMMRDVDQVQTSVISDSVAARRLLIKSGFEPFGTEKRAMKHRGRYYDEVHMVRWLAS